MDLRTLYSLSGALVLVLLASSCSTQTYFSRATGIPGVEYGYEIHPAPEPVPRLLAGQSSSPRPATSGSRLAMAPAAHSTQTVPESAPVANSTPAAKAGTAKKTAFRPLLGSVPSPSESDRVKAIRENAPRDFVVRTTAYSHQEQDSWKFGRKNALGDTLKYNKNERSAAADWSRFPVGTRFKIKGLPQEYVVDDYGTALVGSDTIDIYKPTLSSMKQWGVRQVGIEVIEWGSFSESARILESRAHKGGHVAEMLKQIQKKIFQIPAELRDGFSV